MGKEGLGVGAAIVNPQDQYGSGREKCRMARQGSEVFHCLRRHYISHDVSFAKLFKHRLDIE